MIRYLLAFAFSVLFDCSFGQANQHRLFTVRGIDNVARIQVPGTGVHLVPPPGFQLASGFTGLRHGTSVIEVYDLPGGAFSTLSQDFTREKFVGQGLSVLAVEETEVDGFPARMISLQHDGSQAGFTVVFGDETFTVIIVANFLSGDRGREGAIRESVLGIDYKRSTGADGLSSAAFKLDDSRSLYHYDKRSANTFYYRSVVAPEDCYLTVTQLAWDYTTSPSAIGELMIGEMKKYGLADASVRKKSARRINGYQAFESEIYATRKGGKCLVYQMVVVHEAHALVIHGIGSSDFRKNRDRFRKLAHSVEFK